MNLPSRIAALMIVAAPAPLAAQEARWPLADATKSPAKALDIATMLDPVDRSLTDILRGGGKIVSSYVGATGPVVTVVKGRTYMICLLKGANPATDQNVATSECYAMN